MDKLVCEEPDKYAWDFSVFCRPPYNDIHGQTPCEMGLGASVMVRSLGVVRTEALRWDTVLVYLTAIDSFRTGDIGMALMSIGIGPGEIRQAVESITGKPAPANFLPTDIDYEWRKHIKPKFNNVVFLNTPYGPILPRILELAAWLSDHLPNEETTL